MKILVLNVGSSSIRASVLICTDDEAPRVDYELRDTHEAFSTALDTLALFAPFDVIAHRIVHGGSLGLTRARIIDAEVRAEIVAASDLAPDHNPAALRVINRTLERFGPATPHIAVFDSAFHSTMPPHAYTYAIPAAVAQRYGIRRFGFHGLSHEYSAHRVRRNDARRPLRHVSVHVGNGVSVTAILDGLSIDTTMGFTPLEGAVMGARSGSLDPGILFELERKGLTQAQLRLIVDGESGLLGLSGVSSDYHHVFESAQAGDAACRFALDVYVHRLAGEVARMAASLRGIDALSFTGGVGEHSSDVRAAICKQLEFLDVNLDAEKNRAVLDGFDDEIGAAHSRVRLFKIACGEEERIARHAFACYRSAAVA